MTRAEFRELVEELAGDRLRVREVNLIVDAATAFATGDTWDAQGARRGVLAREVAASVGRGYGRGYGRRWRQ